MMNHIVFILYECLLQGPKIRDERSVRQTGRSTKSRNRREPEWKYFGIRSALSGSSAPSRTLEKLQMENDPAYLKPERAFPTRRIPSASTGLSAQKETRRKPSLSLP